MSLFCLLFLFFCSLITKVIYDVFLVNVLNTRYTSIIIIDLKGIACKTPLNSIKLREVKIDTEVGLFLDRTC